MEFNFKDIEAKWTKYWQEHNTYKVQIDHIKPKYYVLDMFPYPSGAGLHVGHPLGYIGSDIVSRYMRMSGYCVLHPMGFDAFGLPAEQYAIQTGKHPAVTTAENIKRFKEQLDKVGFCYDWDREVITSDPKYYKWTQWIFIQLFNSWYDKAQNKARPISELVEIFEKKGLTTELTSKEGGGRTFSATEWKSFTVKEQQEVLMNYRLMYLAYSDVNWCPELGTVLANDEVKDGLSERGGFPVVKMKMRQWFMRITSYAERLLEGLDVVDWSESLKEQQRNWIGKSLGAEVNFKLSDPIPNPSPDGKGTRPGYITTSAHSDVYVKLKEFMKSNRHNPTEAEERLWSEFRGHKLGEHFRRQHIIGNFIVDFVCISKRLVVEVDGGIHEFQKEYDESRSVSLNEAGFVILRFSNDQVLNNINEVLREIKTALLAFNPPLRGGQGGVEEEKAIKIFTTRPDTMFGATFMVLAPENDLVNELTKPEQKVEVDKYFEYVKSRTERDRLSEVKKVTGVFTGSYAINPLTDDPIPIWISEYVLAGYGTGAIMAVPGHDSRDHAFAKHFKLPIIKVVDGPDVEAEANEAKDGVMVNSGFITGLPVKEAIELTIKEIEKRGIGKRTVNYKLRDAGFSRQRYWGEPFPIVYKDDVPYAIDEKELPLLLPEMNDFKPTGTGKSPLAALTGWVNLKNGTVRETDTMPGYAGSSWYFLRYMDPHNADEFCSREAENYWQDVDLYIGGAEHAVGHLLYSRFWHKFLYDTGRVSKAEPYKKLMNQGMIQGRSSFVYRIQGTNKFVSFGLKEQYEVTPLHVDISLVESDVLDVNGFKSSNADYASAEFILENGKYICGSEVEKMSKSKLNVVNPDDVIEKFGADTFRMYEMFLGPIDQAKPWDTKGIDGVGRFLRKLWRQFYDDQGNYKVTGEEPTKEEYKILHRTIKKVTEDIGRFSFNTAVSAFMICLNDLSAVNCTKRKIFEELVKLLAPFAPFISEELWQSLGNKTSVIDAAYPKYKEEYLVESTFEYPVSINGKVRTKISLPMGIDPKLAEIEIMKDETVKKWLDGGAPKKVIFVPNRIVNIVV